MITRIGSDNLLMVYVHIAHDVQIGDHCILANSVGLAGQTYPLSTSAAIGVERVSDQLFSPRPSRRRLRRSVISSSAAADQVKSCGALTLRRMSLALPKRQFAVSPFVPRERSTISGHDVTLLNLGELDALLQPAIVRAAVSMSKSSKPLMPGEKLKASFDPSGDHDGSAEKNALFDTSDTVVGFAPFASMTRTFGCPPVTPVAVLRLAT